MEAMHDLLGTARFGVLAAIVPVLVACAGPVEVTRTFTPTAASRVDGDKLKAVAVVRDGERIPVPAGSRVDADQIVARDGRTMALRRTDAVVMHGLIAPDESIPGGGRVESSRSTGALTAGVIMLTLGYVPTAYVGAVSSADRVLLAPVVGPWIDLVNRPACVPPQTSVPLPVDPCMVDKAARAALITSGALQGLAAALTLVGLPAQARIVDGDRGVAIVPTAGGASVLGRF
jgi:hypothetical protein